jgi:hypothetical protein
MGSTIQHEERPFDIPVRECGFRRGVFDLGNDVEVEVT